MKLAILVALNGERAARRAAIVVTDVASGTQRLVKRADVAGDAFGAGHQPFSLLGRDTSALASMNPM